jgi:hypothetical protein
MSDANDERHIPSSQLRQHSYVPDLTRSLSESLTMHPVPLGSPYGQPPQAAENPDCRPLPHDWIAQYDEQYVVLSLCLTGCTLTDLMRLFISYAAWYVSTSPL